jgi:hypothetical protein
MRRIMAGLLSAILLISTCAFAADEAAPAQPPAGKSISLVAVGPVDSTLMDRVVAFARENTALNIRVLPAMDVTGDTLDAVAVEAGKAMSADDAALVVLADPSADITPHGVILPEQRVAVVNVKSLKPANGDAETFDRRVEREVMQSIGMLMGAPPCPNPQCAMWQYSTDEELDNKGRNYCPPCMGVVQKAAEGKGVGMDLSSFTAAP